MLKSNPPIFLQTRATTCGIACLMMALSSLGSDIELTKGTEGKLFRSLRVRGFDLVPMISLATYARRKGYGVEAVIENGRMNFWEFWRKADLRMYDAQEAAYGIARTAGTAITYGPITIAQMKECLLQGDLLIVGIDLGRGVKHALLIFGWEHDFFQVVDPLSGVREYPENQLLSDMEMEFGKWFVRIRNA